MQVDETGDNAARNTKTRKSVLYGSNELRLKKQLNIDYAIQHSTEMRLTVFAHRGANGNSWTRREKKQEALEWRIERGL